MSRETTQDSIRDRAYKIGDAGLEKYRTTWKKEMRGVRECLADVISEALLSEHLIVQKRVEKLRSALLAVKADRGYPMKDETFELVDKALGIDDEKEQDEIEDRANDYD